MVSRLKAVVQYLSCRTKVPVTESWEVPEPMRE